MGIPRGSARLLIEEAKARPFHRHGAAARQVVGVLHRGLSSKGWAQEARPSSLRLLQRLTQSCPHDPRLAAQGCMDDITLFTAAGL